MSVRARVEQILQRIRPHLQGDGADVVFVDATPEGVVKLRLIGGCTACPMSKVVLMAGLEKALREEIDGVTRVELLR